MGITERLIEYMENNNISLEKISQQTKIPITKLKRKNFVYYVLFYISAQKIFMKNR